MEVFSAPLRRRRRRRANEKSPMEGGGSGSGFNGFQGVPRSNAGSLPPNPAGSVQIPPPPNPADGGGGGGGGGGDGGGGLREQDRFMPIANVIRIMRRVLPTQAKISDDAKETMQECVSEYISFITGEANDRCQREQRKTITAEDVIWAMSKLGFDDYVDPLSIYLHRYRELEGDHRGSLRGDSLPPLKRNAPQMLQQPQLFAPPQMAGGIPPPSFHVPLPQQEHPHMGMHGEGMGGGYFMRGMYGGGGDDGNGASSSTQFPMPGFDQYGGYK